jgi:hypothetical protein
MDKKIDSRQHIPLREWNKIPEKLRNSIRSKETSLGSTDIKTIAVKEDKELTKMYAKARRYADWSRFSYMSSK